MLYKHYVLNKGRVPQSRFPRKETGSDLQDRPLETDFYVLCFMY
jgi:hypothetical protein